MSMRKRKGAVRGLPFFQCYVDDYDEAVRAAQMTLEQDGFYGRFLRAQWRAQGPLPDNAPYLGKVLGIHLKLVTRLIEDLVAMGPSKITRYGGTLFNPRMQRDIDKRRRLEAAKLAKGTGNPQPQLPFLTHTGGRSGAGFSGRHAGQSPAHAQGPVDNRQLGAILGRLRR